MAARVRHDARILLLGRGHPLFVCRNRTASVRRTESGAQISADRRSGDSWVVNPGPDNRVARDQGDEGQGRSSGCRTEGRQAAQRPAKRRSEEVDGAVEEYETDARKAQKRDRRASQWVSERICVASGK